MIPSQAEPCEDEPETISTDNESEDETDQISSHPQTETISTYNESKYKNDQIPS